MTCTWNSAATLADTLASVQAQTWRPLEHIFVDGGSTDATLDLLDAYSTDPGSKRLLREVRGGIGHAMNAGIAAASGDYIAHLHADDYYAHPSVLATVGRHIAQAQAQAQSPCRAPAWVFGNIQVLKKGRLLPPNPMAPFSYRSFAAGRAWIPHPAVFVRRDVFGRVGLFDEDLRYAMDIDLWLRLAARYPPTMIDAVLAVFRDHDGSVSSRNRRAARREEFAVRRRHAGKAPLAFGLYCLRYLKRMHALGRRDGQQ